MSQVTISIDGKPYRMACEEGQESHLTDLAAKFDRYVTHLKDQFGEIGDLRLTVMAGIMVMDELSEANRRFATMESEMSQVRETNDRLLANAAETDEAVVETLRALSDEINKIAAKIAVPSNKHD